MSSRRQRGRSVGCVSARSIEIRHGRLRQLPLDMGGCVFKLLQKAAHSPLSRAVVEKISNVCQTSGRARMAGHPILAAERRWCAWRLGRRSRHGGTQEEVEILGQQLDKV